MSKRGGTVKFEACTQALLFPFFSPLILPRACSQANLPGKIEKVLCHLHVLSFKERARNAHDQSE